MSRRRAMGSRAQMHDLWRILEASTKAGSEPAALATVVNAKGSTYRRAGARMLITAEGEKIGALSGGCLEEEIAEHARDIMRGGRPRVLSFDTRITHGCHGFVEILVEPVGRTGSDILGFAARRMAAREFGLVASVFHTHGPDAPELGSYVVEPARECELPWAVKDDGLSVLAEGYSTHRSYEWGECFFDVIRPPIRLVIVGASHDVPPLAKLARMLGWTVSVVAHPAGPAPDSALRDIAQVEVMSPAALAETLRPDALTAVVVMTHHFGRDMAFLDFLLPMPLAYLGLLGPKKRREQMLMELAECRDSFDPMDLRKLHSPIGLDLGAECPEEIALSITAEIRAALSSRTGKPLRECKGPIHPQIGAPEQSGLRQMPA